jgi:hypothetical protein
MAPLSKEESSPLLLETIDDISSPRIEVGKKHFPAHYSPLRPSRRHRHRRSVSFSEEVHVREVECLKSLSRKERRKIYMARHDYQRIQAENDTIVELMNQGTFPATVRKYFRGLEFMLPQAREERKIRYYMASATLLQGQTYGHVHDPHWVQTCYSRITVPASQVAHHMGVWDAEAVLAELVADEEEQREKTAYVSSSESSDEEVEV